jgi:ribosomal 30S subunit maturation factor RimM
MKTKKLDELKDFVLSIQPKQQPNAERLIPFVEQIIHKHLNKTDPRIARDKEGT